MPIQDAPSHFLNVSTEVLVLVWAVNRDSILGDYLQNEDFPDLELSFISGYLSGKYLTQVQKKKSLRMLLQLCNIQENLGTV